MRSRRLPRAGLLAVLLSRFLVLIQSGSTTSMGSGPSSTTESAILARRRSATVSDNSTDAGALLGSLGMVSTVYPGTSDTYASHNTYTSSLDSTGAPALRHTQTTGGSNTHAHSKEDGLNATETADLTASLRHQSARGTHTPPQTANTSGEDWVTMASLPREYTNVEGVSQGKLEVAIPSVSDGSPAVLWEVTVPEMLRISGNNGTASPELAWPSHAEILAMAMGSFIVTALVSSLSYQLAISIRRKKTLQRTCSVFIIQNEMHKKDLEADNREPETRF
ncbi:large proline-rich protein bag6-B-like [Ambystoma mexicanum]|uniref:large proline-rich protein bag6-B-like n=1 Tax=Ambystoma mexicanum TaxID=8296 RepID=UPI0037E916DC